MNIFFYCKMLLKQNKMHKFKGFFIPVNNVVPWFLIYDYTLALSFDSIQLFIFHDIWRSY